MILHANQNVFSNITNEHIYRVNKWSVIDRKCKTSSFVVKFRIPSITINNLFVWNCHFIKIDAQNFSDTTDKTIYLIWTITVILPWYKTPKSKTKILNLIKSKNFVTVTVLKRTVTWFSDLYTPVSLELHPFSSNLSFLYQQHSLPSFNSNGCCVRIGRWQSRSQS